MPADAGEYLDVVRRIVKDCTPSAPGPLRVTTPTPTLGQSAKREAILLASCLVFGLLLMPAAIYLIGQAVFGEYGR